MSKPSAPQVILDDPDPDEFMAAECDAWRRTASLLADARTELMRVSEAVRDSWSGAAYDAFAARVTALGDTLLTASGAATDNRSAWNQMRVEAVSAREDLKLAADRLGLTPRQDACKESDRPHEERREEYEEIARERLERLDDSAESELPLVGDLPEHTPMHDPGPPPAPSGNGNGGASSRPQLTSAPAPSVQAALSPASPVAATAPGFLPPELASTAAAPSWPARPSVPVAPASATTGHSGPIPPGPVGIGHSTAASRATGGTRSGIPAGKGGFRISPSPIPAIQGRSGTDAKKPENPRNAGRPWRTRVSNRARTGARLHYGGDGDLANRPVVGGTRPGTGSAIPTRSAAEPEPDPDSLWDEERLERRVVRGVITGARRHPTEQTPSGPAWAFTTES